MRGATPPHEDIAIIAINDKSIAELGRFPWSREHFTGLVDKVRKAGAKTLLIDVLFSETEQADIDKKFAASLQKAGNVTLAMAFDFNKDWSIKGVTQSIPTINDSAKSVGHINLIPDEDGVNRRCMLLIPHEGKLYPSLALRGAMDALEIQEVEQQAFGVKIGSRIIPTDYYNTMLINYTGGPGIYPMYSFADVLKGRIDPEKLRNKILFLGMTALGIYDMRVTPFHKNTPGVEINATIADNIIRGNFIRRSGLESLVDLLFIIILGVLVFIITARLKPATTLPLLFVITAGYTWFVYLMFLQGHWLSIIYPLMSILVSLMVSAGFRFIILDKKAREVRSIFSSYVSPKIVDQIVNDPDKATIGGDSREITIIFFDIKGFTSFSEHLDPFQVVTTLNKYFAVMTKIIQDYDGTVDKFLGDGLMAYWGAPLVQENHAEAAVQSTFALKKAIAKMQGENKKLPTLSFRTGINSGEVIAGNIGAKGKKMEYTVIGDAVNLASRLEGTAKFYGIDVLTSKSTYKATKDKFLYRELDRIRVVGKTIPITIYEPMASKNSSIPDDIKNLTNTFHNGLTTYRNQDWHKAYEHFESLCEAYPNDNPAQIYKERCLFFVDNPPASNWDGVFIRKEK